MPMFIQGLSKSQHKTILKKNIDSEMIAISKDGSAF